MHSPHDLFAHIVDEIDYLIHESTQTNLDKFLSNETLKRAFARSIEIIGEAVKQIPLDIINSNPNIEWRKIAGMRDRLIHGYFAVDYSLIWDVIQNKLPELKKQILLILSDMTNQE